MTVREARLWVRYYARKEKEQLESPGVTEAYLMQIALKIDLIRLSLSGTKEPLPKLDDYKLSRGRSVTPEKKIDPEEVAKKAAWSKSIWALRLGKRLPDEKKS